MTPPTRAQSIQGQSPATPARGSLQSGLRSPGRPLDRRVRHAMESQFGFDFGGIRIHADPAAAESARALDARAYTVSDHIVFGAGEYAPSTTRGRALLGHELAHAVQQRGARASAPMLSPGSALEAQAEAAGRDVASGRAVTGLGRSPVTVARQGGGSGGRIPFTDEDIARVLAEVEQTMVSVGLGLRGFTAVAIDIDEPIAVSRGGAWDDPANKRFLESTTNRLTKNALEEVAPGGPTSQISLRAAKAAGPDAFRAAAYGMLNRTFDQVAELADVTNQAGAAMRNRNRPPGALRSAINRAIRTRIANSTGPEAELVNEALQSIGIDPQTLTVRPSPVGPSPQVPTAPPEREETESSTGPSGPAATTTLRTRITGGAALAAMAANALFNKFIAGANQDRMKAALEARQAELVAEQRQDPTLGFLLIYTFHGHVESGEGPSVEPRFDHLGWRRGYEEQPTKAAWAAAAREGDPDTTYEFAWIPPLEKPSPEQMSAPFPKVALGRFADITHIEFQRAEFKEWGGFDTYGRNGPLDASGFRERAEGYRFFVLSFPSRISYVNVRGANDSRSVESKMVSVQGGTVPALMLDDQPAVTVYPANADTEALFAHTDAIDDKEHKLRWVAGIDDVRWLRPGQVKIVATL